MKKIPKRIFLYLFALSSLTAFSQEKKWTLEECVKYALEKNISVRQSELDLRVTKVDKKDAFGRFLPSINITAGHTWNIGLTPDPITGIYQQQTSQFTTAGGSAAIDIYKGMQNQIAYRRQKMAIIASQYSLVKMQEDVSLNVANAFLQVLFNKENLKVQQQQLQIDQEQAARTSDLVEGGAVPRGDLLDIEATVAGDRQRVIKAENDLLISKLSLAQLMQLEEFWNFEIADEEYPTTESAIMLHKPMDIYNKAKGIRTEIKIAETNLEVAEQDVKSAKAAYQPTLRGFYSLDTRVSYNDYVDYVVPPGGGEPVPTFRSQPPFWNQFWDNKGHAFGVQLSIPVLNGLTVRNNVERAKVALDRSKLAYDQEELDLQRNVYTAYTDAQGALKAFDAAVAAANARAESLTYAKERYEVGLINVFDLNQAQTQSVNAQSEVLRAKYDYIFKVKILEFYFGIPIVQN